MSTQAAAVLVLVALLAAACQASQVDSKADVTISGKILSQEGSPAPVAEVVLAPGFSGFGELLGGTFFTLLSAGLVCLAESPPEPCEIFRGRVQTGEVGSDGSFSVQLKGSDTRTFFGNARPMSLTARLPEGPVVMGLFRVQTEQLELPELRFWEPEVHAGKGALDWEGLPESGYGKGSGYQVLFEDRSGHQVWRFDAARTRLEYDPRILEDTKGGQTVVAQRRDVAPGTTLQLAFRSAQVPFAGEGPPPSRGSSCSYEEEGAPRVPLNPCPVTDGDLFSAAALPGRRPLPSVSPGEQAAPAPNGSVTIDLGSSRRIALVVVRGCSCKLEASPDGERWIALETGSDDWVFEPSGRLDARSFRVSGDRDSIERIREISIWS